MICGYDARACLKIAFCEMYPEEHEFSAKWEVRIAGMIFQTCPGTGKRLKVRSLPWKGGYG